MRDYIYGALFGRGQRAEDERMLGNMQETIRNMGGTLHFIYEICEDGWSAQCEEIPSIITGGASTTPTSDEIEEGIREAIRAAFHISVTVSDTDIIRSVREPAFDLRAA